MPRVTAYSEGTIYGRCIGRQQPTVGFPLAAIAVVVVLPRKQVLVFGAVVGQFRGERKSVARIKLLQGRSDQLKTDLDAALLQLKMYKNIDEASDLSDADLADEIYPGS